MTAREADENESVDLHREPIEPHILPGETDGCCDLHRQREQLARELSRRTETLRSQEMFSAYLAHDLRNPLSAIMGSARVLQIRSPEKLTQESAARILACGRRMERLIEDMLDLTRARLGGGIVVRPAPADFRALLLPVLKEHTSAAPHRRIDSRFAGDLAGCWDGDRIAQVASNLIGNALKHGDATAPVEVEVDGTQRETVTLRVANGGTIPSEMLAHLFDPFRGAGRPGARAGGLGLGLFIVDEIVKAHRGRVQVESAGNPRTIFRVEVPRGA
jgi:signal transduction histidine kinase